MLPRDDDGNHVADYGQKEKRVPMGTPANSDEDLQLGQANAGDGIPLDEEYRGFVRLKGMTTEKIHERTDPRIKTLFVIDEKEIWNFADWADATAMESFRLDESLVSDGDASAIGVQNATDFLRGIAKAPGFDDAVRVDLDDRAGGDPEQLGITDFGGLSDMKIFEAEGPRDSKRLHRLLGAHQGVDGGPPQKFRTALSNPNSPLGQTVNSQARKDLLRRASERLSQPARRAALAQAITRKVLVHEVGHARAVDHHGLTANNVSREMSKVLSREAIQDQWLEGERGCPTRYFNKYEIRSTS